MLVVDDEPDIVGLLALWLGDDARCAAVDTAADLDQALERARERRPQAVVLDFAVGSRKASEILPTLRASCPAAVIAIYTANRREALAAGVVDAGADIVIEKASTPVDAVVEQVLTAALAR